MENIIILKEKLNCSIQKAFEMFTNNTMLEKWLTVKADVVPEVGGKYELFWDPDNPNINSTIGCYITGMEQNNFISFNWKGPEQFQSFMNTSNPLTHIVVFFAQDNSEERGTWVHLFHTGWKDNSEWDKAREYFNKAWTIAFGELKHYFINRKK